MNQPSMEKWVLTIWLNLKPLSRISTQIGLSFHPTYENMENINKTVYGVMSNILLQSIWAFRH